MSGMPPVHRLQRWTGLALVACCPALSLQAEEAGVRLEYRFRAGERLSMEVAHRALTETTIAGTTQSTETATDSTKHWTVLSVDPEGQATLEHAVDDVTMMSRSSDRGQVRWSSTGDAPPPPGYDGVRQSLGVPDGAVAAGAEWTVPQEVVVEVPNGPRRAVRTRLRYRLDAIEDDVAVIDVDTTVLTPLDDPRLEARLLERIWNGTIRFDIASGRVIKRTTGVDRRAVGFSGPESSVHYKASLEETLVKSSADSPAR